MISIPFFLFFQKEILHSDVLMFFVRAQASGSDSRDARPCTWRTESFTFFHCYLPFCILYRVIPVGSRSLHFMDISTGPWVYLCIRRLCIPLLFFLAGSRLRYTIYVLDDREWV